MIKIQDKHKCCGCSACVTICPKQCISFTEDDRGFNYPVVNEDKCIDCKVCESVCPISDSPKESNKPLQTIAATNPDSAIRESSSSGGVFSALAERVINDGGIVYGAVYDKDWLVVHQAVDNIADLSGLRGSKYVQSRPGTCFIQVKDNLLSGRSVMFSGTPCMIAGLRKYLGKDYDNLILVEIVCHGVPSPKVWKSYIDGFKSVTSVSFRDKARGWKRFSMRITSGNDNSLCVHQIYDKNPFMILFLKNLCLRPSCYNCRFKAGRSGSDISIGDLWGIQNIRPEIDDDKGMSLALVYSEKGQQLIDRCQLSRWDVDYDSCVRWNRAIERSVGEPLEMEDFWEHFLKSSNPDIERIAKRYSPNILRRAISKVKRIVRSYYS